LPETLAFRAFLTVEFRVSATEIAEHAPRH
jgi:hypothetical protein